MTTDDIDDIDELRETVQSLRERVSELEGRIGRDSSADGESDVYDRYDRHVLQRAEDVSEMHPRAVMKLYAEAGVHDQQKQKRRTKRLKRIEGAA